MPVFRRAEWPRDHRDEFVAGALVGAVVIVLGYASGIGASTASGAAAPPSPLPAATAPPNTAPGDSGAQAPGSGTGMDMGGGGDTGSGWTGQVPVGNGELPVYGDTGTGSGDGTAGHGGHTGHGTSPVPPSTPTSPPASSPSPSPSDSEPPTDDATCADGEVRLVAPLLTGITQPLFGLLNGTDADETPEPTASPCVGLAPLSSLLGGSPSASPSASPLPEATP